MDASNYYLNALKGTANLPRQQPPSFPVPPHSTYISSLPESRLPNIPPDLVTEILSRIPIKSLLQFRCVCKSWRDLIFHPQFSLPYQNQKLAIRQGECLYDLNFHFESNKVSMVELRYPMRKKQTGASQKVEMPRFEFLGSYRGFLLIEHDEDLYLWNPSIRQCTKVLSLPRADEDVKYERVLSGSGLCYDSSNDNYNAVLAYNGYLDYKYNGYCEYVRGDYTYNGYERITMVASFKSRRWTTFRLLYKLKSRAVVINERLHWVVKKGYENGMQFPTRQIVCFDPVGEEFADFSTPLPYNGGSNVILKLGVLDGCLCLTRHCYDESGYMAYDNKTKKKIHCPKNYRENLVMFSI